MNTFLAWLAPAVALSLPVGTFAQQAAHMPADPPSPQLSYDSAFSDYRPWTDIPVGDWRQLNDDLNKPQGGSAHGGGAAPASGAHSQMPGHAMPMDRRDHGHHGQKGHDGHHGHQMPGAKP